MILKQNQVVCKKCSKVLTVANPKGLRSAFCVCAICHSRIEVNFWVEDRNVVTSLSGNSGGTVTSLPVSNDIKDEEAFLVVNGREYPLSIGNNIVGRWSPTSQADVQLDVPDEYLSRQHIRMNVYRLPNGRLRITVKNFKNKNETMVNDKLLESDEYVVINGDTITMADTVAKLVIKPSKDMKS